MLEFIFIISGLLFGFFISFLLWGKSEGKKGFLPNLRPNIAGHTIYIHHWTVFLLVLIIVIIVNLSGGYIPKNLLLLVIGFLTGGTIHGLRYKDRFVLFK